MTMMRRIAYLLHRIFWLFMSFHVSVMRGRHLSDTRLDKTKCYNYYSSKHFGKEMTKLQFLSNNQAITNPKLFCPKTAFIPDFAKKLLLGSFSLICRARSSLHISVFECANIETKKLDLVFSYPVSGNVLENIIPIQLHFSD